MKKLTRFSMLVFGILFSKLFYAEHRFPTESIEQQALNRLQQMSVKEKIGQKLMLDFRYWCPSQPENHQLCTQDLVSMNPTVQTIISQNNIGGIILFSNNLKDIPQITSLTDAFQQTMHKAQRLPLLIGTDQEGGIVSRLPRDSSVTFPGNMAIAAAHLGQPEEPYNSKIAKVMAKNLKAVGISIDFAPDVDVNVNPLNPIINVRSFSDDPELVHQLGLQFTQAMQEEGIAATLKHFPGHGDTVIDSHIGLPIVTHTLEQAMQIDLYPFKQIIEHHPPELIMTAHIQFPALDDSLIYADKSGKNIMVPATLSHKIQSDLLRNEMKYQGVIITDALDMGAIAQNFDAAEATIKAFIAGDDIALMPITVSQPEEAHQLTELISKVETAVVEGRISAQWLDQSVLRIIKLKMKLGLLEPEPLTLSQKIARAQQIISDQSQRDLERAVTNDAITLVQNKENVLPIHALEPTRIHILTPWLEQGAGIAEEIKRLQRELQLPQDIEVSFRKMADTHLEAEKLAIDQADIVIVGNSTTKSLPLTGLKKLTPAAAFSLPQGSLVFPDLPRGDSETVTPEKNILSPLKTEMNEAQFAFQALAYAKAKGKKTIFISLFAPYDLPHYQSVSDAMLAGYNFYGYLARGPQGYYRGPSMPALTRVIFGIARAKGKLPVNIPNPIKPTENSYERGYGLTN
ncbi:glycoside hydrolase family 3 protein [Legionella sp.]|uniref:glycoside hydrolase family 3 protein n=1 Tax=Legionella sp. TaxID=459 RepID=UPI00321FAEA8